MKTSPIQTSQSTNDERLPRVLWWSFFVLGLVLGLSLLLIALLPFQLLQQLANLLARDGSLEAFTVELHHALSLPLSLVGLAFLAGSLLWWLARRKTRLLTSQFAQALRVYSFRVDLFQIWDSLRSALASRVFSAGLLLLIVLAAGMRWVFVNQPMRYDESYTVVGFAARPLWNAISDYHLPNNHVFHTLLVHGMLQVFGFHEWAVRLPALIAGVLCVPLIYLVGTALYNRPTGLLAAAWVAFSPLLIDASTNARGYVMVAMFTLLLFLLAAYVLRHSSLLAWGLLSITAALGFFTLPTMLYPFVWVYIWLALSWLLGDAPAGRRPKFLFAIVLSAAGAGLLTLLFYLPILLVSGPAALLGNRFVQSLSWLNFTGNLPVRAADTWATWTNSWPLGLVFCFAAGLLLSVVGHSRFSRFRVHLLLPAVLGIGGVLVLQRVSPLARIWSFLLPICLLLAAAGWIGGVRILLTPPGIRRWQAPVYLSAILLLSGSLIIGTLKANPESKDEYYGPVRETEQIAVQLASQLEPGEVIVANSPIQAPLRFYLLGLGVPQAVFYNKQDPVPFESALVVIERGLDLENELARVKLHTELDPGTRLPIAESAAVIAYRIFRYP